MTDEILKSGSGDADERAKAREYQRQWRAKNRARTNELKRQWRDHNLETHRAYQRDYMRQWREDHREQIEIKLAEQREKTREQKRKWRAKNRERVNELNRQWRKRNREAYRAHQREYVRQWRAENPERSRKHVADHHAKHRDERNRKLRVYRRLRLSPNREQYGKDLFETITTAMPKGLPAHIRDDVVGTVALQVIDQKEDISKIKALVKAALSATWGQSDWFKHISIDAPLTDDFTLLDTLTSEQPTPEEALTRRR